MEGTKKVSHMNRMRVPEKENNQCETPEGLACLECLTKKKGGQCVQCKMKTLE